MAKINKEEYRVLKALDDRWKWIARDDSFGGSVFCFRKNPYKDVKGGEWGPDTTQYKWLGKCEILFQFIQWEDEEPKNIKELIEEYESEESEVKTKREIIEDIDGEMNYVKEKLPKMDREKSEGRKEWHEGYLVAMKEARNKVNRLDEPETLTPEWIDERIHYSTDIDTFGNVVRIESVPVKFLQNLIMPKQELPVIPKFVADFIEKVKPDNSLRVAFEYIAQRKKDNHDDELAFWVEEGNSETFARAWLDGYTAEEEPLYRARLKVITDEFIASYLRTQSSDAEDRLKALEIGSKYIHEDYRHLSEFTEDELKRLDIWDSEQWELEELEE